MSRFRKVITVAAGSIAVAGSLVVAGPASAKPATTPETLTFLTTHPVHVTTTTGKHLLLSIGAQRLNDLGHSNANSKGGLTVTLRGNGGHEIHQWQFVLAPHSFSDDSSGAGHITTGSQIAPYGKASLTISPTHNPVVRNCGGGNHNVIHQVAIKGDLKFLTHSTGADSWGNIPTRGFTFLHAKLTAGHGQDVEEACTATFPCQAGISWTASHGHLSFNGNDVTAGTKPRSTISGNRFVNLSTPANAMRFDTVTAKAPAPALTSFSGHAALSVASSGAIATGSAALVSVGHKNPYAQDCGVMHQVKGSSWNAHYHAGTTPLTFHEQIFGPMTIATDKAAEFQKVHIV